MRQSSGTFHLTDYRIKSAVGVLRRAKIAQARVRLRRKALEQRRSQPRFANTCLARQKHHLAFASLRLRPTPQQQFKVFFPSDKLSHAACV